VVVQCGTAISGVRKTDDVFTVETSRGVYGCASLIVATGGLSIPKLGATAFGYELAKQFGHTLVEPRAALVPLVFNTRDAADWCDLTGTSAETVASAEPLMKRAKVPAFREKFLITHRGVSGPAVLQISSYWKPGGMVTLDLAPGVSVFGHLLQSKAPRDLAALYAALKSVLPQRMADRWLRLRMDSVRFTNSGIEALERELHAWVIKPDGSEGYAKAEVTAGGVNTAEIDSQTMESLRVPGLYFIGEVVDVTGWLGGYNFQWAWASAVAAGRAV